jgi:4-hydroxybenzoate polyprenyltransferase
MKLHDNSSITAWIMISRPLIVFISVFGALVGGLNVHVQPSVDGTMGAVNTESILLLILGAGFLGAGLMIHNDVTDLASDRINKPYKILPRNILSPRTASLAGIVMMLVSVLVSFIHVGQEGWRVNRSCGILTVLIFAIGILYNYRGKSMGLWGHVFVAFGVGSIPLWGALKLFPSAWRYMFPLAFSIFIMEIGREIMVCIQDYDGDRKAGFLTLPVRIGRRNAMYAVLPFYIGFILLIPVPYCGYAGFPKIFSPLYLTGASIFALVLFYTWERSYNALQSGDPDEIFRVFERYIRTGTRVAVVFFQFILCMEILF